MRIADRTLYLITGGDCDEALIRVKLANLREPLGRAPRDFHCHPVRGTGLFDNAWPPMDQLGCHFPIGLARPGFLQNENGKSVLSLNLAFCSVLLAKPVARDDGPALAPLFAESGQPLDIGHMRREFCGQVYDFAHLTRIKSTVTQLSDCSRPARRQIVVKNEVQ